MSYHTILLPTDFSKCANDALDYALELVKSLPMSRLILLHSIIYNDSFFVGSREKEAENTRRFNEAKSRIDEIVSYIKKKNQQIKVKTMLDAGPPVKIIDLIADKERVDLIIMGTKGASGLREIVIGSYAAKVIKCAGCPVLIVPENFIYKRSSRIVCTTEFHFSEVQSTFYLIELVKRLNASLIFLNISDNVKDQDKKLQSFQKSLKTMKDGVDTQYVLIHSDNILKSIEQYVKENPADLLVTLGKRRDFWKKMFGTKISENLSFHSQVPLLSFPFQEC